MVKTIDKTMWVEIAAHSSNAQFYKHTQYAEELIKQKFKKWERPRTLIDFRNFSAITHYFGDTILNCLIQGLFGLIYI